MGTITVANFQFTASVIIFSSWLSQKRPDLAGFIIALPLASLLALALAHLQHGDAEKSIAFGPSIFLAVPASYLFFIPFFIPKVSEYGFWLVYGLGLSLLVAGFFLHQVLLKWLGWIKLLTVGFLFCKSWNCDIDPTFCRISNPLSCPQCNWGARCGCVTNADEKRHVSARVTGKNMGRFDDFCSGFIFLHLWAENLGELQPNSFFERLDTPEYRCWYLLCSHW